MAADSRRPKPGHVIVFGNEKGGSGKSTTAMHVIVALLKAGHSVASIDTDGRQRTLTRYIENRALWRKATGIDLELPTHFNVPPAKGESVAEIEDQEFRAFGAAVSRAEHGFDFLVIDTPGHNSYLMQVSHAMADTLVTPINDSFIDFDVIARVDPVSYAVVAKSHYAEIVDEARRQRALFDNRGMDWIVVRNRLAPLESRNRKNISRSLDQVARTLGLRLADGISERLVFREFFLRGLTALDTLDAKVFGGEPTLSHIAARREIAELIEALRLPIRTPRRKAG